MEQSLEDVAGGKMNYDRHVGRGGVHMPLGSGSVWFHRALIAAVIMLMFGIVLVWRAGNIAEREASIRALDISRMVGESATISEGE
jgi:hypothetical protein